MAGAVTLAAAFAAGTASFSSPCVLPLVPAYLSLVAGMDVTASASRSSPTSDSPATGRAAVTLNTLMFIGGFGAVFVLLGLSASGVGRLVVRNQTLMIRI